jgi:hypothetical protein
MTISDPSHLIRELHDVLDSCHHLAARHQELLDQYRDADGFVLPDRQADYDEVRIDLAIEASDHLDTVVQHLADLVAGEPGRTFTVTLAGPERVDGERPTSFAVRAVDLDDARRVLAGLPGFQQWYRDHAAGAPNSRLVFLPDDSHPSLRAPGQYIDLRPEQTASAVSGAGRTEHPSSPRPSAPSPTDPHRPRR